MHMHVCKFREFRVHFLIVFPAGSGSQGCRAGEKRKGRRKKNGLPERGGGLCPMVWSAIPKARVHARKTRRAKARNQPHAPLRPRAPHWTLLSGSIGHRAIAAGVATGSPTRLRRACPAPQRGPKSPFWPPNFRSGRACGRAGQFRRICCSNFPFCGVPRRVRRDSFGSGGAPRG